MLSPKLAQALVDLRVDEETEKRYHELADRLTEGQLTEAERDELHEFVVLNRFLSSLRLEAMIFLRRQEAA